MKKKLVQIGGNLLRFIFVALLILAASAINFSAQSEGYLWGPYYDNPEDPQYRYWFDPTEDGDVVPESWSEPFGPLNCNPSSPPEDDIRDEPWSCFDPAAPFMFFNGLDASVQWTNTKWVTVPPPSPGEGSGISPISATEAMRGALFCFGLGTDALNLLEPGGDPPPPTDCYQKQTQLVVRECIGNWCEEELDCPTCEETCPSCGETPECEILNGGCSVIVNFSLGFASGGGRSGYLRLHQGEPSERLFTVRALEVEARPGVDVLRTPGYAIRQVLSDQYLLDVTERRDGNGFTVRMYLRPKELQRDEDGYLMAAGEPFRWAEILRSGEGDEQLTMIDHVGGKERKTHYTWSETEQRWDYGLETADFKEQVLEYSDVKSGELIKERRRVDLEVNLLRSQKWIYRTFHFGERLVGRSEAGSDGEELRSEYEYYSDEGDPARLGRIKSRSEADGWWTVYLYDDQGRASTKLTPWKDSPLTDQPEHARAVYFERRYLTPEEAHYHPEAILMEERVEVLGVPVSKRFTVRSEGRDGGRIAVAERSASPEGSYGGLGNRRSVTVYYPERENDPASGRVRRQEDGSGQVTSYTYTRGEWLGAEGLPGDFIEEAGGEYIRTETMRTPSGKPEGIVGRSIKSVAITGKFNRTLYSEQRLKTGEGEFEALLSWSGQSFDKRGRRVLSRDQSGITGEYRYNDCCNKLEWERDAEGIETHIVYDDLNRVRMRAVEAPGREAVETWYEYDASGKVISTRVVAGDLVQESASQYDGQGNLVARTGADGLTTRYEVDEAERTRTTILPGGATRIERRYRDGRSQSITGTSLVAQYQDYGVEEATGHLWSETVVAKPDGPRWSRSYTNPLGQAIRSERPGYGEGIVLAGFQKHDEKWRVISTAQAWYQSGAAAGADRETLQPTLIGAPTLSVYDEETGELELSGQDIDRNGKLEPVGSDRLAKSETMFEKIGAHWYQVRKSWTWPREGENAADPVLIGESRQRVTGLGSKHDDYGVLVSESVSLIPIGGASSDLPSAQAPVESGKSVPSAQSVVKTYRDRETATTTTVSPTGVGTIEIAKGGFLDSYAQFENLADPESQVTYRYAYDAFGRHTESIDPRTGVSKTEYEPATGRVLAKFDPEGRKSAFEYYSADHPSAGQLKSTTNPDGKTQYVAYSSRGQQLATWGQTDYPFAYQYNDYGEMIAHATFTESHTEPDTAPSAEAANSVVTRWHYDEATGILLRKEYADGNGTDYIHTPAGQLKERLWARVGSGVPADREGNKTPAPRLATTYHYDNETGNLHEVQYPSSKVQYRVTIQVKIVQKRLVLW